MYKINVISSFSGAHYLKNYDGACKNMHGHNWKVRVQLISENTDKVGLSIDFKIVKERLKNLLDKFDHQCLNELDYFLTENPTSENIAFIIYTELKESFKHEKITMSEVEIWESETNSVIFCES